MEGKECAEIGDLCSVPEFDGDVRVKYCYTVTNIGTFTDTVKAFDRCFLSEGEEECFDLLQLIPEEDRTLAPGDGLQKCEQVSVSWCDGLLHSTCVYADATMPEFEEDCKQGGCYDLPTYTPPPAPNQDLPKFKAVEQWPTENEDQMLVPHQHHLDPAGLLTGVRERLQSEHFVWIEGWEYRVLLLLHGATEADLAAIETGRVHSEVAKDTEPVMHFWQIAFHCLLIKPDPSGSSQQMISPASMPAVTQISSDEIASTVDDGATVSFQRSGTRHWNLPPSSYANSTVATAMAALNSQLLPNVHHPQPNINIDSHTVIDDQALIRINQHVAEEAEATPEGVHQDGTELSSVTMVQRQNVGGGGESRIWSLKQPLGQYASEEFGVIASGPSQVQVQAGGLGAGVTLGSFDWNNCLLNRPLLSTWETVIFNDRMVKHEARPFVRGSGHGTACRRDVIVNFIRKPLKDGSDKQRRPDGSIVSIE